MTAPMSAAEEEEVLAAIDDGLAVLEAIARGYSGNPEHKRLAGRVRGARRTVAAMVEREAALVARHAATERDACLQAERANELESRVAALVKEVEALRAVPEKIAKGWDGCYYDDDLSETSIGDRIRHDASRLIDAARAEARDG